MPQLDCFILFDQVFGVFVNLYFFVFSVFNVFFPSFVTSNFSLMSFYLIINLLIAIYLINCNTNPLIYHFSVIFNLGASYNLIYIYII